MTFDPNSDLIWALSVGQQGKISSGVFADIDKTTGTLCPESAHTSKKLSQKPPVYKIYVDMSNDFRFCNTIMLLKIYEPRYEKTGFLRMRKQRRRSASR